MTSKQVSVRLSATGGRQVRAELEGVGEAGARGFGRLSREMEAANQRMASFWRRTNLGLAALGVDVWEIKLGDDFLMTSHFTASEVALGKLGIAACNGDGLEVVVGGLGLGYTAQAVLAETRVADLRVVEYLAPVIEWHENGILPIGTALRDDPRCRMVAGDFFAMAAGSGFDPDQPGRQFDVILADIDHAPDHLLDPRSDSFYQPDGLRALKRYLKPGGTSTNERSTL